MLCDIDGGVCHHVDIDIVEGDQEPVTIKSRWFLKLVNLNMFIKNGNDMIWNCLHLWTSLNFVWIVENNNDNSRDEYDGVNDYCVKMKSVFMEP